MIFAATEKDKFLFKIISIDRTKTFCPDDCEKSHGDCLCIYVYKYFDIALSYSS